MNAVILTAVLSAGNSGMYASTRMLWHLTGKDEPVRDYVLNLQGAEDFVDAYVAAINPVLDGYLAEQKPYVTLAVGCTGGKHRSVAISEAIATRLRAEGRTVRTVHRDLGRE